MEIEYISLFIHSIKLINPYVNLNNEFGLLMNDFIYEYYNKQPDKLSIIFNLDELEEIIESNCQILPIKVIIGLYLMYNTESKYLKLLESISFEDASKINELVLLFLEYCNNQYESYINIINTPVRILH